MRCVVVNGSHSRAITTGIRQAGAHSKLKMVRALEENPSTTALMKACSGFTQYLAFSSRMPKSRMQEARRQGSSGPEGAMYDRARGTACAL